MIPVILSGGSGTRLWPVSRANYPKQFCDFYDRSFLRTSVERLSVFGQPHIVTVKDMKALTKKTAFETKLPDSHLIFEPLPKNTAAAVALTCHMLELQGYSDQVVGIFPADHLIADEKAFQAAIQLGIECAKAGEVVTLGIYPRFASTGYGYIETQSEVFKSGSGKLKAFTVKGFREKPDQKTAEQFLQSGQHFWNAGIFLFKVSVMIEHFSKWMPTLWKNVKLIEKDFSNAKYQYALLESQSLDYGIMEKLERQVCIPCDIGWSDVGSWDELARLNEEFPQLKSESHAQVFTENTSRNYVFSIRPKVVGMIGVEDVIVVDTPDALLLVKKGQSQQVKALVDQIKKVGLPEATEHPFETRPWGGFEVLSDRNDFKVKYVHVEPGQRLSYQSHNKRQEFWVVIQGQGEVILNETVNPLKVGDSIQIPVGTKHRIKNTGTELLKFVEVQTGTYFGEDDIIRYQDDYER